MNNVIPLDTIDDTNVRLADAVYESIGRAILDGRLAEGTRIRDMELAEQLGVSRMPVREALQRLERIGLVEMSASRYTRVTTVSPELVRASLEYIGYQAGVAARMALPKLDATERERAAEMVDRMIDDIGSSRAFEDRATAFYRHLSSAAGNRMFDAVMREMWLALQRNLHDAYPLLSDKEDLRGSLTELRQAVVTGDADGAERLIREQHGLCR